MTGDVHNAIILQTAIRVFYQIGPFLVGHCPKLKDETHRFVETRLAALEMELQDDIEEYVRQNSGGNLDQEMPEELAQLLHLCQHAEKNATNGAQKMEAMMTAIIAGMN